MESPKWYMPGFYINVIKYKPLLWHSLIYTQGSVSLRIMKCSWNVRLLSYSWNVLHNINMITRLYNFFIQAYVTYDESQRGWKKTTALSSAALKASFSPSLTILSRVALVGSWPSEYFSLNIHSSILCI